MNKNDSIAMDTLNKVIGDLETRLVKQQSRIKTLDNHYKSLGDRIVLAYEKYYDANPRPEIMNVSWRHKFMNSEEHKIITILELRAGDMEDNLNFLADQYNTHNTELTNLIHLRKLIESKLKKEQANNPE